ncbi:uncharacterized protein Z518_08678 [Rhinocladiella mackenziei CBS 650.93]|uniref:N(6)-L-threonylcarbamoyladenine synthase n=1 Tax=Rhinocladiella mackenziei CBS 650.93 TaxID=1442369 RepID=A0A0D2IHF3_9EURO|nr:uncharacterized protein Z518_08678 [Rhinocladiella mackenziei CBS 650.93]KIX02736.1 hypothetical protein Z518_08678 [Rhinocladiella mackenziei CBS 650.93]
MLHGPSQLKHICVICQRSSITLRLRRNLLTLAIESSCDDTCVSILSKTNGPQLARARQYFNEKITVKNTGKGGIFPPEALDSHQTNLSNLIEKSLPFLPDADEALPESSRVWLRDGTIKQKPDLISVTRGPGMSSNLGVGLSTAKGLATAWQIPMVGVHHMQAHALTPRLVDALKRDQYGTSNPLNPAFPFLTLLISGGHTMLLYSKGLVEHSVLATTTDTAIGDELDKCGRVILPKDLQRGTPDTAYGKYLSEYAFQTPEEFTMWNVPRSRQEECNKPLNRFGWTIRTPLALTRDLAFSFSGIGSQVQELVRRNGKSLMDEEERILLARATLGAAFEHLGSRTIIALEQLRGHGVEIPTLVVSGGVAANTFLRYYLRQMLDLRSFEQVRLVFPPVELCTDNAAMIGWAGMEMFQAGYRTDLGCDPRRKWSMDSQSDEGGILGIGGWIFGR